MITALDHRPAHLRGRELAEALFAHPVAVAARDPHAQAPPLFAEEAASMRRAVPRRYREFAAGRAAAREAAERLGITAGAIPMGADRAPLWPEGLVGSISHCDRCCLAAVAPSWAAASIGLDVEEDTPLDADLIAVICTPAERNWLATQPRAEVNHLAKLIFSAKECAYKCQYPLTGRIFGFDGLEIALAPDRGEFTAHFLMEIGTFAPGCRLFGRFQRRQGLIVTAMKLAPDGKDTQ